MQTLDGKPLAASNFSAAFFPFENESLSKFAKELVQRMQYIPNSLHCLPDESDTLGTACLSTLSLSIPSGQTEPLSLLSQTFHLSIRITLHVCKRPLEGSE